MKKERSHRKPLAFALALLLTLLCLGGVRAQATAEGSVGSVVLSVEKFTIGQGYLIEPHIVPIYSGDSCARVFDRCMKDYGYEYDNTGRVDNGFYLSAIRNADNGKTQIPDCIRRMGSAVIGTETVSPQSIPNVSSTGADLGEFSYGQMSGWYFSYNGQFPNVGMSQVTPADGGVMRVQYTVWGLGADLGNEYGANPAPLEIADKEALTRKVAEIQGEKERYGQAYQEAIDVLVDLEADEWDVERCLERLNKGPSETETPEPTPSVTEEPKPTQPVTETPEPAKPAAPAKAVISKAASVRHDKLKISWKKVKNASGYQISRAASRKGRYATVATLGGAVSSYTDGGLTVGRAYYYKVRAFAGSGAQRVYGAWSEIKSARPALSAPSTLRAAAKKKKASLKWSEVKGASGYEAFRSAKKNSGYKKIATKKAGVASYTDQKLTAKRTYYYKVRAYRTVNGKRHYSKWSKTVRVRAR